MPILSRFQQISNLGSRHYGSVGAALLCLLPSTVLASDPSALFGLVLGLTVFVALLLFMLCWLLASLLVSNGDWRRAIVALAFGMLLAPVPAADNNFVPNLMHLLPFMGGNGLLINLQNALLYALPLTLLTTMEHRYQLLARLKKRLAGSAT